jgi:triple functional domain protein
MSSSEIRNLLHGGEDARRQQDPPLAQQEDLAEEVSTEQMDTPSDSARITPISANPCTSQLDATSVSSSGQDINGEEEGAEEEVAVEMPPPMEEIHTHPLPSQPDVSQEDIHSKLSSTLSLKTPSDTTSTVDLAQEIENIIKNRGAGSSDHGDTGSLSQDEGNTTEANTPTPEVSQEESNRQKYFQKRKYVITELIDTEKDYVRDLGLVVEGYMPALKDTALPEGLESKDKIVFGNIHQIYDWHKETFLSELEKCADEPERLGSIFDRYERRLYMYVKYCENKPKSEYIVAEFFDFFEELRQKMGHRLTLPDLLIKPVQRIMKYQLLLRDILKYSDKAGEDTKDLQRAVEVMCIVPKAANDMMNVGRLQGFTGKITAQGKLLLQDTLLVMEKSSKLKPDQQKLRERRVFLFEQIIIFSEETEKKKNNLSNPGYIYKNSLKVNNMTLNEKGANDPNGFMLVDKTPGSDLKVIVQAPSEDVRQNWVTQIRSISDMLVDFLTALQSPIAYQKELTKELSAPEFSSMQKNSMLRKTQSQPAHKSSPPGSRSLRKDSQKHKSMPAPGFAAPESEKERKTSCPTSPTAKEPPEKAKLENKKTAPAAIGSMSGSPKPRRFKNPFPLKGKAKQNDGSSGKSGPAGPSSSTSGNSVSSSLWGDTSGTPGGEVYANVHSLTDTDCTAGLGEGSRTSSVGADMSSLGACGGPHGCPPRNSASDGSLKKRASKQVSSDSSEDASPTDGPGSVVKVSADYSAIREDEVSVTKGEMVQIIASNQHNMLLVHRPANDTSPAAEGWIPSHVLGHKDGDNGFRKSWHSALKIRKPSFTKDKSSSKTGSLDRQGKRGAKVLNMEEAREAVAPSIMVPLRDVTVHVGDTAVFTCRVCGRPRPGVAWRGPDGSVVSAGPQVTFTYAEDGTASLQLQQVPVHFGGEYSCLVTSEKGCAATTARLNVIADPCSPGRPVVIHQSEGNAQLHWLPPKQPGTQSYALESIELGAEDWTTIESTLTTASYTVENLRAGATYQFRVIAIDAAGCATCSEPSIPIRVPSEDELTEREESGRVRWKTTYDADFLEIGEIARGRFSIVKKVLQVGTDHAVAAKAVSRRLVSAEGVETEFNTLQSLQHPALPHVLDLFATPTSHVLLLELLPSGRLFDHICSKPHFDEIQAGNYTGQLLDACQYLHNCRIAHLDIKPENLLIDLSSLSPHVKLIDFGDARHIYNNYYVHPLVGSPEFAAPELVGGSPVGLLTDIWSVGVVVYVMLSGVSPFLDESLEETCSNIMRRDFCFPDEYFAGISHEARSFISSLLIQDINARPSAQVCLDHVWVRKACTPRTSPTHVKPIPTARLGDFIERRKHQLSELLDSDGFFCLFYRMMPVL